MADSGEDPHRIDPGFRIERLFHDPTPDAQVNTRILLGFMQELDKTDLSVEEQSLWFRYTTVVARKLVATWRHLERYERIEDEMIEKARASTPLASHEPERIEYAEELFTEMDEFLVQMKSSLDYLVKVPCAVLGANVWSLRRFGSKGKQVLNAMENGIPDKYKPHMRGMKLLVFEKHGAWLAGAIELRDIVNHGLEGGVPIEKFSVRKVSSAKGDSILVPIWSNEQTLRDALHAIWESLLAFVEIFMGCFLFMRLQPLWAAAYTTQGPATPSWKIILYKNIPPEIPIL